MSILENQRLYRQIETVIDLAVALVDYTQSPERCREIPRFLGESLGIDDLTVAIVRKAPDASGVRIVMCNSSVDYSGDEQRKIMEYQLLDVHRRYQFEIPDGKTEFAHILHIRNAALSEEDGKRAASSSTLVFARGIDRDHDLLLMIRPGNSGDIQFEVIEDLQILTNELSKQFQCMISWQRCQGGLSKPFNDLNDLEWKVLRGLTTEASEKQLASQLKMSPNSLHSRIKSIYRKMGVQGRLPLIQKFNSAVSDLRISIHRSHVVAPDKSADGSRNESQVQECPGVEVILDT